MFWFVLLRTCLMPEADIKQKSNIAFPPSCGDIACSRKILVFLVEVYLVTKLNFAILGEAMSSKFAGNQVDPFKQNLL